MTQLLLHHVWEALRRRSPNAAPFDVVCDAAKIWLEKLQIAVLPRAWRSKRQRFKGFSGTQSLSVPAVLWLERLRAHLGCRRQQWSKDTKKQEFGFVSQVGR